MIDERTDEVYTIDNSCILDDLIVLPFYNKIISALFFLTPLVELNMPMAKMVFLIKVCLVSVYGRV